MKNCESIFIRSNFYEIYIKYIDHLEKNIFFVGNVINLVNNIIFRKYVKIFDFVIFKKKIFFPFFVQIKIKNITYSKELLKRVNDNKNKFLKNWIFNEYLEDNFIVISNK